MSLDSRLGGEIFVLQSMSGRWYTHGMVNIRSDAATRQQQLRGEIVRKLGGVCARCGFSDVRALHIDHVNGDGQADRPLGRLSLYYKVRKDTEGRYQLLCSNCNWIKRYEQKEQDQPMGIPAICHPDSRHYAKGLCRPCYSAQRFADKAARKISLVSKRAVSVLSA